MNIEKKEIANCSGGIWLFLVKIEVETNISTIVLRKMSAFVFQLLINISNEHIYTKKATQRVGRIAKEERSLYYSQPKSHNYLKKT